MICKDFLVFLQIRILFFYNVCFRFLRYRKSAQIVSKNAKITKIDNNIVIRITYLIWRGRNLKEEIRKTFPT